MEKRNLLDNISKESIDMMIPCFKPIIKKYLKDEVVISYEAEIPGNIAVIRFGEARLDIISEDGDSFPLDTYEDGDVFGDLFSLPMESFQYVVTATKDSEIMFLNYEHVIKPCKNICNHHSQLISNLFVMTAQKTQELTMHVSILSQSSTRDKLMTYLKQARSHEIRDGKDDPDRHFTIQISLSQLADYIRVDRSAMMREIKSMKEDGLIESKSRTFRII